MCVHTQACCHRVNSKMSQVVSNFHSQVKHARHTVMSKNACTHRQHGANSHPLPTQAIDVVTQEEG